MTCRANCCVDGCRNTKQDKKYSFFKLPLNKERCKLWLKVIGRPDLLQRNDLKPECHFVCSAHFDESMIIHKPLLKPNAVPTRFLPESGNAERIPDTSTKKNQSTQTDDIERYEPDVKVENQVVEVTIEPVDIKSEPQDGGIPVRNIPDTEGTLKGTSSDGPSRKRFLEIEHGRNTDRDLVKVKKEK